MSILTEAVAGNSPAQWVTTIATPSSVVPPKANAAELSETGQGPAVTKSISQEAQAQAEKAEAEAPQPSFNLSDFPPSWSDRKVLGVFANVVTSSGATRTTIPDGSGRVIVTGTHDGVDVSVVIDREGRILDGYRANPMRSR